MVDNNPNMWKPLMATNTFAVGGYDLIGDDYDVFDFPSILGLSPPIIGWPPTDEEFLPPPIQVSTRPPQPPPTIQTPVPTPMHIPVPTPMDRPMETSVPTPEPTPDPTPIDILLDQLMKSPNQKLMDTLMMQTTIPTPIQTPIQPQIQPKPVLEIPLQIQIPILPMPTPKPPLVQLPIVTDELQTTTATGATRPACVKNAEEAGRLIDEMLDSMTDNCRTTTTTGRKRRARGQLAGLSYSERMDIKRQRNRDAAKKCRQKKLNRILDLEQECRELSAENEQLTETVEEKRVRLYQFKFGLFTHRYENCYLAPIRK